MECESAEEWWTVSSNWWTVSCELIALSTRASYGCFTVDGVLVLVLVEIREWIREEGDLDWETAGEGLSKVDVGEISG